MEWSAAATEQEHSKTHVTTWISICMHVPFIAASLFTSTKCRVLPVCYRGMQTSKPLRGLTLWITPTSWTAGKASWASSMLAAACLSRTMALPKPRNFTRARGARGLIFIEMLLSEMNPMISPRKCVLQQSSVNCREQCVHRMAVIGWLAVLVAASVNECV